MLIKNAVSFADVHWGITRNNRLDDLKSLLRNNLLATVKYVNENNIDAVFINGDLLDKHNVSYGNMNECRDIINSYNIPKSNIFIIPGNHCLKNNTFELIKYSAISVITSEFGSEHPDVEQWAFGTPPPVDTKKPIIQIHQYIDEENYMEFFNMFPNCKYLLSGDNHQHFIKRNGDQVLLNSGPLVRNKSNEEVVGFFHIDFVNNDIKCIPLFDNADNVFKTKINQSLTQEDIININKSYLGSIQDITGGSNITFDDYINQNLSKYEMEIFKNILNTD